MHRKTVLERLGIFCRTFPLLQVSAEQAVLDFQTIDFANIQRMKELKKAPLRNFPILGVGA
jgi:hypothetical protein